MHEYHLYTTECSERRVEAKGRSQKAIEGLNAKYNAINDLKCKS